MLELIRNYFIVIRVEFVASAAGRTTNIATSATSVYQSVQVTTNADLVAAEIVQFVLRTCSVRESLISHSVVSIVFTSNVLTNYKRPQ